MLTLKDLKEMEPGIFARGITEMLLKEKIEQAKNLIEMNALRMEVVKAKDRVILKLWQDKYWGMKKCPTCSKYLSRR